MTSYIYDNFSKLYTEFVPSESIYNESRRSVFNIMNGMTNKILHHAGLVEAQYCHAVSTNKEILQRMLLEEKCDFKKAKLAKAMVDLDAETLGAMIVEFQKEQENVGSLIAAVVAASTPTP